MCSERLQWANEPTFWVCSSEGRLRINLAMQVRCIVYSRELRHCIGPVRRLRRLLLWLRSLVAEDSIQLLCG